jgi:hypothetical protein
LEREEQLRRVPVQKIDESNWPRNVRPISIGEIGGLGIDTGGRLHWNGKPVEIVGRRLDLTWGQFWIAIKDLVDATSKPVPPPDSHPNDKNPRVAE